MRDILSEIETWTRQGKPVGLAAVVQTWGSSPRGVGARMAFTAEGEISGSVSGGCVEGAVLGVGLKMLKGGSPRLLHFDVADETAWEVGLTCGGSLDVFVSRLDEQLLPSLQDALAGSEPLAMITVIAGPEAMLGRTLLQTADGRTAGKLGKELDTRAAEFASEGIESLEPGRLALTEGVELLRDVFLPQPSLIIVGGVHVAVALAALARTVGWQTVLIDPRKAWGSRGRFADVDQLLQVWPEEALQQLALNRSSAVVTLTHDPKLDDAALLVALRSRAFYVGALGSASSNEKRRKRLLLAGLNEKEIARLHAPVGLRIGAQTPEEIALAIMAEITSEYRRQGKSPDMPATQVHVPNISPSMPS